MAILDHQTRVDKAFRTHLVDINIRTNQQVRDFARQIRSLLIGHAIDISRRIIKIGKVLKTVQAILGRNRRRDGRFTSRRINHRALQLIFTCLSGAMHIVIQIFHHGGHVGYGKLVAAILVTIQTFGRHCEPLSQLTVQTASVLLGILESAITQLKITQSLQNIILNRCFWALFNCA